MNCVVCDKPLTGGLDTFGPQGQEVCQEHWLEKGDDPDMPDTWYGLAPHEHTYDKDGKIIIGATKFTGDPTQPIEIDGYTFYPDPEAPGCGVWSRK